MSHFQRVVDLTASDHDEGEASESERQGLPASPVVAKLKPGRPPLPPDLRKPPRSKSDRPMGRPRKYRRPTEEDKLVTGPETGPDLTQPKRNHESPEERLSSDRDDDSNEYRTSDRLSKQALQDTGKDRQIRQGHSRQLIDDGFSAWTPGEVLATVERTRHEQTGPDKRPLMSVDRDHVYPSQRYKRRYSPGSENAQQDVFSQHRNAGEIPHSARNKLIGINRKGLSDKSSRSTTVNQSSDDEGLQMQFELFQPRQLVKTVTKEFFEEHLDWLECHEVPVNFNKFWSKEDEFELLWHWSQGDEDMHNAFVSQEMPLSIDMKRIWGLTPPRCLPDGLEFSIQDNDFLEDGHRNTNLSASICDLLHTCLLLPAFHDALPFFQFMVKKAVYLRLSHSPYKVEKPREVDLMMKASQEQLTRISGTVKSYTARFVNSAEADTEKAVKDLINELSLLEVNRSGAKELNGYDHLAMRHELRKSSSSDTHDTGVTPGDLSAIIDAWKAYAEKNKLRQAHWYRADHELRREASDIPSRTHWARIKKALTMSILRSAKVSSRKEMAEEKARIFHPSHMQDKTYEVGQGLKAGTVTEPRQQTTTLGVTGVRKPSPVLRSVSGQNLKYSGQVQSSISQHLGNENASKRREARDTQYDSLTDESYESDSSYDDEESVDMTLIFADGRDPNVEIVEHAYVSTEYSGFLSACRAPKVPDDLRFG